MEQNPESPPPESPPHEGSHPFSLTPCPTVLNIVMRYIDNATPVACIQPLMC